MYCNNLNSVAILNPECEIYDSEYTISNNLSKYDGIICGYSGSTAEAYAKKYNRTFVSLGNSTQTTEPTETTTAPQSTAITTVAVETVAVDIAEPATTSATTATTSTSTTSATTTTTSTSTTSATTTSTSPTSTTTTTSTSTTALITTFAETTNHKSGSCGSHATWLYDMSFHSLSINGIGDISFGSFPYYVESVSIPNGITGIGDFAFSGSSRIPNGKSAFYGLTSITIPDSVTSTCN